MNAPKLQLEAGKFYRTRDDRKAFVAGFSPFDGADTYRVAVGFIEGYAFEECWAASGQWGMNRNDKDLVAEWVEPKRIKGKMYIGENSIGVFGSYISDGAKPPSFCKVVACIEIDVLEGQGLEGEAGR